MHHSSIAVLHYTSPPVVGCMKVVIRAHARVFIDAGHTDIIIARWAPSRFGSVVVMGTIFKKSVREDVCLIDENSNSAKYSMRMDQKDA